MRIRCIIHATAGDPPELATSPRTGKYGNLPYYFNLNEMINIPVRIPSLCKYFSVTLLSSAVAKPVHFITNNKLKRIRTRTREESGGICIIPSRTFGGRSARRQRIRGRRPVWLAALFGGKLICGGKGVIRVLPYVIKESLIA